MPSSPTTLSYYGGKNLRGCNGRVGRWVANALPLLGGYAEPCAGMLSVLIMRPPAKCEIANDADGCVTNWWKCVRDRPDELAHLVEHTPKSRSEFYEARSYIREHRNDDLSEPSLKLAWAFQTVVRNSLFHGAHGSRQFRFHYDPITPSTGTRMPEVRRLANRIRDVQLDNRDAARILERLEGRSDWSIYFDPPYAGVNTDPYGCELGDRGVISDLLKRQRGAVAVSGYPGEWDHLDWNRTEFASNHVGVRGKGDERTEVVWTNFPLKRGLFA